VVQPSTACRIIHPCVVCHGMKPVRLPPPRFYYRSRNHVTTFRSCSAMCKEPTVCFRIRSLSRETRAKSPLPKTQLVCFMDLIPIEDDKPWQSTKVDCLLDFQDCLSCCHRLAKLPNNVLSSSMTEQFGFGGPCNQPHVFRNWDAGGLVPGWRQGGGKRRGKKLGCASDPRAV
jgi:hypothetical protein